ncbi:MAG TPA: hypothetical protein VKB69_05420, partial [Micromonosporaceae bacterium]|nr:hypothetical protein [Micromonosporaceae bacterium]
GHPAFSELYFIRSAGPYLALLAACGIAVLSAGLQPRRAALLVTCAGALGVAAVYVVRATAGATEPAATGPAATGPAAIGPAATGRAADVGALSGPYALLFALLLVLGLATVLVAGLLRTRRSAALLAVVVLALGTTAPAAIGLTRSMVTVVASGQLTNVRTMSFHVPLGGIAAAKWLRDHSRPDDVVATNEHCLPPGGSTCDSRDFWVSAFAERRVLVEGWAYTNRSDDSVPLRVGNDMGTAPFWDPALLAANDAVFTDPNAADVARLAGTYHVRWLVAVGPHVNPALSHYAQLRHRVGSVSIYELEPAG